MTEHIEQVVTNQTGVAASGTFQVNVDASGADRVAIFVDDGAGNAPASYDFDIEVSYNDVNSPTYMPRSSVTGSTATHHVYTDIAPFHWRITFTNSSGASADYRVRVITLDAD